MPSEKLIVEFEKYGYMPGLKRREFESLVRRLIQQDLLPGVIYDGFSLYIEEEHYKWKKEFSADKKTTIARAAARELTSDSTIILDSGSSTEALVDVMCHLVELGALKNLRVVTNSTRAVSKLLDTVVQLAGDEATAPIRVYVTGGVVRPNTLAIVGYPTADQTDFGRLVEALGGGDIAFVGVNGIDASAGFTTHTNAETHTKQAILGAAKRRCILGDSAKFGIIEPSCFATLDDEVELFTNDDVVARTHTEQFTGRRARIHLVPNETNQ
jgi:DeoR/GlpR family transcriptional regulator of sugar metabolism